MLGKFFISTISLAFVATVTAQQVEVPREHSMAEVSRGPSVPVQPSKLTIEDMRQAGAHAAEQVKEEMHDLETDAIVPPRPIKQSSSIAVRSLERPSRASEPAPAQSITFSGSTALVKLADGFDLPVGKPDGKGYYNARGFTPNGHLGDDWNGLGGGDTDLGDPIYSIGNGVVVFARDCHQGWGNVVILRHAYREGGRVHMIDSLYGHLDKILVHGGQAVARGQQVGTMGTAHGLYDSHLHLEIRKNIAIGMSRDKFAKDRSNYCEPEEFIVSHRHLETSGASYRVAMNTFTYDARIQWDNLRNFAHAHSGGGTSESAYALKKALAAQSTRRD
ncbi:MAG TPA: M23 family metallopeptidase [Chthoniobacterales bacterium]|nr:M23 family metallopeptidase [Chthoniobacterales bacterium]